jgi:hypothetical protein
MAPQPPIAPSNAWMENAGHLIGFAEATRFGLGTEA